MNELFLVFTLTLISSLVFYWLDLKATLTALTNVYKQQLDLVFMKGMDDDLRQKELLKNIPTQLKFLAVLAVKIIVSVSPFLFFILLNTVGIKLKMDVLLTMNGISTSLGAIFVFIILKYLYVKLFKYS